MKEKPLPVLMPSEVSSRVGFFDRFAGLAARLASRAPFFAFCLLLVIAWLVQGVTLIVSKGASTPSWTLSTSWRSTPRRRSSPS